MSQIELGFSVMFFSASEESVSGAGGDAGGNRYRLILDAARFADRHGFEAIWVPERHFAPLGGLYPNPSVLSAAVATVTERVGLRAGSVVAPLHNPLRIAEEWSMVDNLSGGRAGVSFASGWNPADFTFFPDRYEGRREEVVRTLEQVRRLWAGETVAVPAGGGRTAEVRIYPSPLQKTLPVWLTAARSPETFAASGRLGTHVLTHLLDQDVEGLTEKIALYRRSRAEHGHDPATGRVTLMIHTFVAADAEKAREEAREPYCRFLKTNVKLLEGLAASRDTEVDFNSLSPQDQDAFVNFLYDRFVDSRALIGSPETTLSLVGELWQAGVDEIACLLDFGPSYESVLEHLGDLDELRRRALAQLPEREGVELPRAAAVVEAAPPAAAQEPTLEQIRERSGEELSGEDFYRRLGAAGLEVEPEARGVERLWRRDGEALGELAAASAASGASPTTLLEAALQVALAALPAAAGGNGSKRPRLPQGWRQLRLLGPLASARFSHATLAGGDEPRAQVRLLDAGGEPVATLSGVDLGIAPSLDGEEDGWTYELRWESSPVAAAEGGGSWLILADGGGVGEALAARLRSLGGTCRLLRRADVAGNDTSGEGAAGHGLDLEKLEQRLVAELAALGASPRRVAHLFNLDAAGPEDMGFERLAADQAWGSGTALAVMQALAAERGGEPPRLWIATRGAQPVADGDAPSLAVGQSPVWGLGRTCAVEQPRIWGGLVDLDPAAEAAAAAEQLLAAAGAGDGEDQVAWRGGERRVARLVRVAEPPPRDIELRSDGSYLVTGGLSGIGRELCLWLARRGAGHVVIAGRSPLPARDAWDGVEEGSSLAEKIAGIRRLEEEGAEVTYVAADVADPAGVAELRRALAELPPLRGVFHAASVWRDAAGESLIRTLPQLDLPALLQVYGPKVLGSWLLHETFRDADLDVFFLFSSGASLTGSAGQANYAAASTFLDTLAHLRRGLGLPALSVNWGPVSGAGFGASDEGLRVHEYWEANGLKRIHVSDLEEKLFQLLPHPIPQIGVMRVDWERLGLAFPELARSPWSRQLMPAPAEAVKSDILERLTAAPPERRRDLLLEHLQGEVGRILRLDGLPDPRRKLFEMGMDSLMALELKNRLQADLGGEVPVTAIFNFPTLEALGGYLLEEALDLEVGEPAAPPPAAVEESGAGEGGGLGALDRIRELSDEEAERMLAERLSGRGAAT